MSQGFLHQFTPVVVVGHSDILTSLHSICATTTLVCDDTTFHDEFVSSTARSAHVCFVDGKLNATMCEWLLGVGVTIIVTMTCPRRMHSSWIRSTVSLKHAVFGGVTDGYATCFVFHRRPMKFLPLDSFHHERDAHTIIDDSVWCHVKRRKPTLPSLHPLRVINVGSATKPVVHVNGLLPIRTLHRCLIITPAIGLGCGTWGVRSLTSEETALALDMSLSLIPSTLDISMLFHRATTPAKLWEIAGCLVCGISHRCIDTPSASLPIKRPKLDIFKPAPLGVSHHSLFSDLQLQAIEQSAVKSDAAVVDTSIWLQHFFNGGGFLSEGRFLKALPSRHSLLDQPMDVLRGVSLVWWKRRLVKEYSTYLIDKFESWKAYLQQTSTLKVIVYHKGTYRWSAHGLSQYKEWWRNRILLSHSEWMKGCDALLRALKSSWWEWEDGSAPFYWRWPMWYHTFIRDGIAFPFKRAPPKYMVPQRSTKDSRRNLMIVNKLEKVLDRRYMGVGIVKSLTAFFDVPKGTEDIRMVYDGTVNGFNDSIEVPRFGLPTVKSHLRAMAPGYHMVDADVGECFLNFHLHTSLQPYVGVDLTSFMPLENSRYHWVRWNRAGMGLKSSPYQACQAMMVVEEVIRGNRKDKQNPFRWDDVVENLPGSENYDPTKPWIYKVRFDDGRIACDIFIYVDDLRITGWNKLEAWRACCRATSILGYLGVQDAPRKRRNSSNMAGAWAGSVVYTTSDQVLVLVTEEKWCKAKAQVEELSIIVAGKKGNRKRLQQIRGFLNYVAATYPILSSYLMGLHLTIDGWRKMRYQDGWKKTKQDIMEDEDEMDMPEVYGIAGDGPSEVEIKPRLITDVNALKVLITGDKPPLRNIRSDRVTEVYYGFGDASGSAFGATLGIKTDIWYEYGQWCSEDSEQSSNWRELKNLVDAVKGWVHSHDLSNSQLFIFTDNTTAESAYWKGTSKSKKLCDLVLELKSIALWGNLDLHVVHVSGKRMIHQGTDGLSRGDQNTGVMNGTPMKLFVPLHIPPSKREKGLKAWIDKLLEGWNFTWLNISEWFEEHHSDGNFVWDIPPAAGDLAYEMLDKARLKRPTSTHILLIPRLYTGLWRRLLTRRSDCYIKIDWESVWNIHTHYEPLLLFICIPYRINNNFESRRNSLLEKFQGTLQECRMSKSTGLQQRHLLRKFLQLARDLPTV